MEGEVFDMLRERQQETKIPAMVTFVEVNGVRKRVKLVFHHHHFNNPKVLKGMGMTDMVNAPTLMDSKVISTSDELPSIVAAIVCPGGTTRYWPRGVTVARLIDWPSLEEVRQGDGDRRERETVLATGYAVCSSEDNYERAVGRHFALEDLYANMLATGPFEGPAVRAVAECYARRTGKKRKVRPEKTPVPRVTENLDPGDEISVR